MVSCEEARFSLFGGVGAAFPLVVWKRGNALSASDFLGGKGVPQVCRGGMASRGSDSL